MIRPIITEKSYSLAGKGWYTFAVDSHLDKNKAKKLIEDVFGVQVSQIKSILVKGKTRRNLKSRRLVRSSSFKKIIVKLAKDQKIDIFEGIS